MYRYELHAHTAECDKVASSGGAELVRAYAERGYHGMVITDHYFSGFFDWFREEVDGKTHREILTRWLKGYYAARNEGEKLGFTVLPGAELRIDGTPNDYLLYGLEEEDFYRLPLLNRCGSLNEALDRLPSYVLAVQAHPFRNGMTVGDPSRLFGIEVYNGGTEDFRNAMALTFAAHYGKAATSGTDTHGTWSVGKGGILTESPIRTVADLRRVLTEGDYRLILPEESL